jgi:hypothetical protein
MAKVDSGGKVKNRSKRRPVSGRAKKPDILWDVQRHMKGITIKVIPFFQTAENPNYCVIAQNF